MLLAEYNQLHLIEEWDYTELDRIDAFFKQLQVLDSNYPEGLGAYIMNARKLLADSAAGANPLGGFTPEVPTVSVWNTDLSSSSSPSSSSTVRSPLPPTPRLFCLFFPANRDRSPLSSPSQITSTYSHHLPTILSFSHPFCTPRVVPSISGRTSSSKQKRTGLHVAPSLRLCW